MSFQNIFFYPSCTANTSVAKDFLPDSQQTLSLETKIIWGSTGIKLEFPPDAMEAGLPPHSGTHAEPSYGPDLFPHPKETVKAQSLSKALPSPVFPSPCASPITHFSSWIPTSPLIKCMFQINKKCIHVLEYKSMASSHKQTKPLV